MSNLIELLSILLAFEALQRLFPTGSKDGSDR